MFLLMLNFLFIEKVNNKIHLFVKGRKPEVDGGSDPGSLQLSKNWRVAGSNPAPTHFVVGQNTSPTSSNVIGCLAVVGGAVSLPPYRAAVTCSLASPVL